MTLPRVSSLRLATFFRLALLLGVLTAGAPAQAATLDGSQLSVLWAVPFAGILLSIAIWPLAGPHFWHHHFGKIAAAWALAFLVPFALVFGAGTAMAGLVHALLAEYIPFILLLTALFTVSGGEAPAARAVKAGKGKVVKRAAKADAGMADFEKF